MKLPPLSLVLSILFMVYVINSILGLLKLFSLPECTKGERCIPYYLQMKPKLQLAVFTSVKDMPMKPDEVDYVGKISDLEYSTPFEKTLKLSLPLRTQRNGTLYLHLFVLPQNRKIRSWNDASSSADNVYTRILLTYFQAPITSTFQLLKGEKFGSSGTPVSHLKTEVGINILTGIDSFPEKNIPPELYRLLKISRDGKILPMLHYDILNDRLGNLQEITNNSSAELLLKYSPINIGKLRLMLHTEQSLSSLKTFGFSEKDLDQVKGIFADTNIYLLSITIFVSSVHLLFDFLALKNDVSFWRSRSSLVGLSMRTVLWRAFSQVVILLYLMDEETSLLVLGPAAVGTLIELWKVQKVIPIDWRHLKFKKVSLSDDERKTRLIDAEGMHYLTYLLYPLCTLGAVYTLFYQQYKSWYSWIIHSLVNGVYAFGFLFMLPQLFINYKLKSVAHLPWRAFMYKAFNTFIDDLFAFIIAMPTAHRLACFRDDIVFLVYLYQRWLYPVDKTRIDESAVTDNYGQGKKAN